MTNSDENSGVSPNVGAEKNSSRTNRAQEIQDAVFDGDANDEEYIDELHQLMAADDLGVKYEALWGLNFISNNSPEAIVPIVDDIYAQLCVDRKVLNTGEALDKNPYMTDELSHYLQNLNLIQENPRRSKLIGELMGDSLDIDTAADEREALDMIEEYLDIFQKKFVNLPILLVLSSVAYRFPTAVAPATDELISLLQDDWEFTRKTAVSILGLIGSHSALEGLAQNLEDESSPRVRHSYKFALLMNENPEIVLEKLEDFKDGDDQEIYNEFIWHIKWHKLSDPEEPQKQPQSSGSSTKYSPDPQDYIKQAIKGSHKSYQSAYVGTLAELLRRTATNCKSTSECIEYLKQLRDGWIELDGEGDPYEPLLADIENAIEVLDNHYDNDEVEEDRVDKIIDICGRVDKYCRINPD